jgi:hypothetical protein
MPLLPLALEKKGQLAAFTTWFAVEPAPALQPSIMILLLSPPNAAIFSETHCSAASREALAPHVQLNQIKCPSALYETGSLQADLV